MEQRPRILIVDDDQDHVRLLRSAFEQAGYEVINGFDGVEGLDLATKHIPDLIITGIIMPRMSGFEMMRQLKNNVSTASVPILVYSHLGREQDRLEAQSLGARDFLLRELVTPRQIIERASQFISKGKAYYIDFDPQKEDAKALAQAFDIAPYFECPDGSRMLLKLEAVGTKTVDGKQEFRATFVCNKQEAQG